MRIYRGFRRYSGKYAQAHGCSQLNGGSDAGLARVRKRGGATGAAAAGGASRSILHVYRFGIPSMSDKSLLLMPMQLNFTIPNLPLCLRDAAAGPLPGGVMLRAYNHLGATSTLSGDSICGQVGLFDEPKTPSSHAAPRCPLGRLAALPCAPLSDPVLAHCSGCCASGSVKWPSTKCGGPQYYS